MKNPLILALTLLSVTAFAQTTDTGHRRGHKHDHAVIHHPTTAHVATAGTFTTTYSTPTMTATGGSTVACGETCATRPQHRYKGRKKHCHTATYHAPPGICKKHCH